MVKRDGKRKTRDQLSQKRYPKLGHYLIVTDTKETEKNYFTGLRNYLPIDLQSRIVIKVHQAKTGKLVDEALRLASLEPHFAEIWIVLDRDQVKRFDQLIVKAEAKGIKTGWSNPCIEIWFNAYFGEMPACIDSVSCCKGFETEFFRTTGQKYQKSDPDIYAKLHHSGDEQEAIRLAKQKIIEHEKDNKTKPSTMCPATKVHILVEEITSITNSSTVREH